MINDTIRSEFAVLRDLRLHYITAGSGDKLVILLHGFPEFWYSWRHQIEALSEQYTVVAPDMRGFNLSDKPTKKSDYAIEHLVDDIANLISHFGQKQAAVIGHDWGASVAWAIAIRRPEMLWAVGALQVPPIPVWRKNQTLRQFAASWYMFFFQLPLLPELLLKRNDYQLLARSLRQTTAQRDVFTDDEIDRYKEAWAQPFATTAMLNYYRANILRRLFGKRSEPSKIKVPALFIYGEKDTAVLPATVEGVGEMIDAPYYEFRIPNSGHWVQQEARDQVTEILRGFLGTDSQIPTHANSCYDPKTL